MFGVIFRIRALFYFYLLVLCIPSSSFDVLIVFSNSTNISGSNLTSFIESFSKSAIDVFSSDFTHFEDEVVNHPNLIAVFDITNNLNSNFDIAKYCELNLLVHFLVSDRLPYHSKCTYLLSSSKEDLKKAIFTTLNFFNWTDGVAIADSKRYEDLSIINSEYSSEINSFSVGSETYFQDFIGREIMKLGSSLYYLFLDKELSLELQKNLVSSKLVMSGTGILLIGESSYKSSIEGALAIVDKGRELIDSNENYLFVTISEMIDILSTMSNSDDIKNVLEERCTNNHCITEFSLINIQSAQRKIVGSIKNRKLSLNNPIIFPGNSTEMPKSQKKVLFFSASNGSTDPGGSPVLLVPINTRGITLAVKHMNSGTEILQNFQLSLNDFDCGVNRYNPDFCLSCFGKDISKIGLAHIGGLSSSMAMGQMATFKKLNNTVPLVSATNADISLGNSTKYPYYSRINLSLYGLYAQIPLLLKAIGWNNMAVIYQNDSIGITCNDIMSQASEKQNINILNKNRAIPTAMTREQIKNWTHVFQEIIDLNVRLVYIALNAPLCNYAVEMFYDLGLRRGDIFFYSGYLDSLNSIGTVDEFLYKRLEIGIPLMNSMQSSFIGNKGKEIHDELYSTYNNTEPWSFACPYFDAAHLIGSALDWAINRGLDYNNPDIVQKSIRDVKFIGCTGTVYIQKNSNDRSSSSLTVQVNSYSPDTGITIYTIGYLKPSSSEFLTIIHPITYADGTTIKPPDFRVTRTNCPFDDNLKQTFPKGRALVFAICFFIAALTIIITFLIWKKWWNIKVEKLTKSQEISVQDFIIGVSIGIEFFQILSMGPEIRPLNDFIADIGDLMSLDLGEFFKLENGIFWWLATTVIILSFAWLLLCLIVLFRLDEKYNNIYICKTLGFLAEQLMPVLGNLCFMPFISILLDVFVCDQSIGDNFTESFLAKDCYQFCWKDSHIMYAVLSAFAIVCYEPFAVFCRPLWQELQSNLHVKSIPLYLMMKTVIQVLLIVMNKTLKRTSEITHGCVFTVIIILYTGFIWKFKAYNYARFNWWQQLSLIGVAWISLLATICAIDGNTNFPYLVLILSGWCLIAIVGVIVQRRKYPSLLYRKKAKDTSTLFKFAFTFGKQSKILHSKISPQKLDLSL